MKPSLVGRRTSQPIFQPLRSRQADTFISYQGQRPSSAADPAPDLRLLRSAATLRHQFGTRAGRS